MENVDVDSEYIMAKCEEILESNEECKSINKEILQLEDKLFKIVSPECKDLILRIESLTVKQFEIGTTFILKTMYLKCTQST